MGKRTEGNKRYARDEKPCTCESGDAWHTRVWVETRGGIHYGAWLDPEAAKREKIVGTRRDGKPRVHKVRAVKRAVLHLGDYPNAEKREDWARDKAAEINPRFGDISRGAERHSNEEIEKALERYVKTKQPFDAETNPTGRKGLARRPGPWESPEAHAAWEAHALVADKDAARPASKKTISEDKRMLDAMVAWLALRDVTTVRHFDEDIAKQYAARLAAYPKDGGGVLAVSTANQHRKSVSAFLAWLGSACPAHETEAFKQVERKKIDRAHAERLQRSFVVGRKPASPQAHDAAIANAQKTIDIECHYAELLVRATLAFDETRKCHEMVYAPAALGMLLMGSRPIETNRLTEENFRAYWGTEDDRFIDMDEHVTKTRVARAVHPKDVSLLLLDLIEAQRRWQEAARELVASGAPDIKKIEKNARMLFGLTPRTRAAGDSVKKIRELSRAVDKTITGQSTGLVGDVFARARKTWTNVVEAAGLLSGDQAAQTAGHEPKIRTTVYGRQVRNKPGEAATLEQALGIEQLGREVIIAIDARTEALRARLTSWKAGGLQAQDTGA